MAIARRCATLLLPTLVACASAPPVLIALPPAPLAAVPNAGASSGPTVLVRRVIVPGYLDGFPVVIGRHGEALMVADDEEWAERLSDAVARVLRDALSQRLGSSRVLIEGDGRIPDADLTVEFLALDPHPDSQLRLDARWTFLGGTADHPAHSGRIELRVPLPPGGPTASNVAAATAAALGRLADALAIEAQRVTPP
jgi:uncharacterized lipoprotein YmbA